MRDLDGSTAEPGFPAGLLDWWGCFGGCVRKLFYQAGGRPSRDVVRTSLLNRLDKWVSVMGEGTAGVPSTVLLVGGSGSGKSEAVEFAVGSLDAELGPGGDRSRKDRSRYTKVGNAVPPIHRRGKDAGL
jgi:hypothetical protein